MGLKSIEMQVALPRTQDIGKMQEQQNQREMINQQLDSEENRLKSEQERRRAGKTEATEHQRVNDDQSSQQQSPKQQHKKKQKQKLMHPHPYKGKHVDLSL